MKLPYFNGRLFLLLASGFIFFTVIGTLTHESGHYLMAKYYGFRAEMHYGSVSYHKSISPVSISGKGWLITLAGPLQTVITGSIGLMLIFRYYASYRKSSSLDFLQWIPIFLALFWLRQSANLSIALMRLLRTGKWRSRSDETNLDAYFHLSHMTLSMISGAIGFSVLAFILFRMVPKHSRVTFALSGIVGGVSGFWLWMTWLGPKLMP